MISTTPYRQRCSPAWLNRVRRCVHQEPLVDTRLSLSSLRRIDPSRPPHTIFVGIGLCAREQLSQAVPIDLLGLLLPAEAIRRKAGARELFVLIADSHALENGFAPDEVERRARSVEAVLTRIGARCGLSALTVMRASRFHDEPDYRAALATVSRRARGLHDYVLRQLADAVYLDGQRGALMKIGWALRGTDPFRQRDEIAFDRALRAAIGDRIGFLYCKPGRSLTDQAPRVPPYVVRRPDARVCLDWREDPASKLAASRHRASEATVAACRRHLKQVIYTYGRLVEPLPRGPLEDRLDALIHRLAPRGYAASEIAARSPGPENAHVNHGAGAR